MYIVYVIVLEYGKTKEEKNFGNGYWYKSMYAVDAYTVLFLFKYFILLSIITYIIKKKIYSHFWDYLDEVYKLTVYLFNWKFTNF